MDNDAKQEIATFRFGVIPDFIGRKLNRGEKELILTEKSSARWEIPFSTRSHISRSTILSWVRAYEKGGRRLESLYPDERKDKGTSRVMDEEAVAALIHLKKDRMGVIKEQLFSDEAILAIHQGSGGLLRRADLLAKGRSLPLPGKSAWSCRPSMSDWHRRRSFKDTIWPGGSHIPLVR